jgi:TM2 domain-containing membrane protein YozV
MIALILAVVIPGAGQSYNGQPIRGYFLFFFSVLILPWLYSLWSAWSRASEIRATGGRMGKGGFFWVFMQFWLLCNTALAVVLVMTMMGHFR